MLSVLLALSLWIGLAVRKNISVPTAPQVGSSDQPEDGQPVRLALDVELKEDSKGEDSSVDELDMLLDRDFLAPASPANRRGWQVEVRSLVSQRVRAGHGARGPPHA
jgi:hypothetical protein